MCESVKHHPNLYDYHVENANGEQVLVNISTGEREEVRDLVFHGGSGFTLERRRFSRSGPIKNLLEAGFRNIQFL